MPVVPLEVEEVIFISSPPPSHTHSNHVNWTKCKDINGVFSNSAGQNMLSCFADKSALNSVARNQILFAVTVIYWPVVMMHKH